MPYQILDDGGQPIDAHFDVDGRDIIFHSRGGAAGETNARNLAYSEGLRLVLDRLARAGVVIEGELSRIGYKSGQGRAFRPGC